MLLLNTASEDLKITCAGAAASTFYFIPGKNLVQRNDYGRLPFLQNSFGQGASSKGA